MTDGHGDDLYRYDEGMVRINFSSNVYQHPQLDGLKAHLNEYFGLVGHYPEPQPRSLERKIALREGISPEAVLVTSGATEAIYLIAQMLRGSFSIIPQPTFGEYSDACRINGHVISYESNEDIASMPRDRVYWICNPNNPSGNVLMKGFMTYVVRRSPRYTFVVDQSYEDYTRESLLSPREMFDSQNLLLIHSLGKRYGVPGLRLGYVTGHPQTIQLLRSMQHPWSVSALSIEAGHYLLDTDKPAVPDLDAYLAETERFRTNLRQKANVRVFETKTNFMLCEIDNMTAADLKFRLVHEYGMLIRDCQNFSGLGSNFFRVATQLPEENDLLVEAISGLNA